MCAQTFGNRKPLEGTLLSHHLFPSPQEAMPTASTEGIPIKGNCVFVHVCVHTQCSWCVLGDREVSAERGTIDYPKHKRISSFLLSTASPHPWKLQLFVEKGNPKFCGFSPFLCLPIVVFCFVDLL